MRPHIPYAKLSKRERRVLDAARRVSWGMSPVTRKPKKPGAYDRAKTRKWDPEDLRSGLCSVFLTGRAHSRVSQHFFWHFSERYVILFMYCGC